MKASWYAEALYGALQGEKLKSEDDPKKILARFRNVLSSHGHDRLLPSVAREIEKIIVREKDRNDVVLVTADNKSRGRWAYTYDHYEKEGIIPEHSTRRDAVDETIIGGFQIKMKGALIDGSYKKSLVELYRSITS